MTTLRATPLSLPSLRLEGGLFLPDILEKAALGKSLLQTKADYALPKSIELRDEASRAFQIACAQWRSFAGVLDRADINAERASTQFVTELLRDVFAYPAIAACSGVPVGDRLYPITHLAHPAPAALVAGAKSLAIVIAPHTLALDTPDARYAVQGAGARRKSAFQLAQELLNASADHEWALVSNGRTLRLLRDAATLTRPSYLEVDLQDLLAGQRFVEFGNAWRVLHASRAGLLDVANDATTQTAPPVVWATWQQAGQDEGIRVRKGLRQGVTNALVSLGQGFVHHPGNDTLRQQLQSGVLKPEQFFAQLLRLVYRFIFLFTTEERGLLPNAAQPGDDEATAQARHAAAQLYADGYAMARLRTLALRRRAHNRHEDLWQAVRIVFRGLDQGQPRLGLPALGGLFAAGQCEALDVSALSNADLLAAMKSLRWAAPAGGSLAPIDYRNMDTEELGSVYEGLLELHPRIDVIARRFELPQAAGGSDRKTSGSYYTPDSLVQELIRSALDPVIEDRVAKNPAQPVEALLSLRVVDPACGSGHFLLGAARRLAERVAGLRSVDGAVSPQAYRHALREVVARCIFGVDRNPMAIELARTALWIEGFEEGRPLGFLDHHLQCGDALLGLTDLHALEKGIAKDAFKALSGDDKAACRDLARRNSGGLKQLIKDLKGLQQTLGFSPQPAALDTLRAIEAMPAETTAEVAAKEVAYRRLLDDTANSPLALAADLAVGAYLLPKTPETVDAVPTNETLHAVLTGSHGVHGSDSAHAAACKAAREACKAARVFHWPLAFPQVFAQGGFDCVLGNPPWERIKLQEEEFFAERELAIAEAKNKAERAQRIQWLSEGMLNQHLYPTDAVHASDGVRAKEVELYQEFITARRTAEASSVFAHVDGDDGGRYRLTGVGDVNTYALFAETILQIHSDSGRAGFIVPTGIATDDTTKAYFGELAQSARLASLYGFWEIRRLFPGTDSRDSFCLLTLGRSEKSEFIFYAKDLSDLRDTRRKFTLTPEEFKLLNPNTLTCPIFRSNRDAELTKKLYRAAPVLIRDGAGGKGNPWGIDFQRMLDMANDSHLFKDAPAQDRLPLYEAKLIHHFDHRWATYTSDGETRPFTPDEKRDPTVTITPRYWVPQREVWLKVSTLPEGLRKALEMRDASAITLCVTQLLFGWWMKDNPEVPVYPAWQLFVQRYPYAAKVAPTSLGLCGNNPPSIKPLNDNYLPAEGSFEVFMSNERSSTAWYAVDPVAWERVLEFTANHQDGLHAPEPGMAERSEVLALAERWLEESCPNWLMGWRDIARTTDERTLIASLLPTVGVGNKIPLIVLPRTVKSRLAAALVANLSALTLDYVARQKIGGSTLNYFYVKQLPVLSPAQYGDADLDFIVPRVLELSYTAHDMSPWAKALGYDGPPFGFDAPRRAILRGELDAYFARLYGLTRDELLYILDPAEIEGSDYPTETFRVLKANDQREFNNEYRTRDLVMDAWDRLHTGELH
ncbi:MAG: N-6 DNA methylase [Proteobacteria bacterium]|nr:N-6 DNA methylase [Pseudomonadota bacterium]